jgi:hypothetical protein
MHLSMQYNVLRRKKKDKVKNRNQIKNLPKDITARPSLTICTHALVQPTSILHLGSNACKISNIHPRINQHFILILFHCNQASVWTYFSIIRCVSQPRNNMPKYMEPIVKTKWKNP